MWVCFYIPPQKKGGAGMDWYVCGVDVRCIAEDVEHARKAIGYEALLANSQELFGFNSSDMKDVIDKLGSYSKEGQAGSTPVGWW
jgi:hypothetical protein